MKILIVEDEQLLADALSAILKKKGFSVDSVYDGISGMEYAETGIYDLLIIDIMMPGMDGCIMIKKLRDRNVGIPILMLTAKSEVEDRIRGLNAGADCYLPKPFDTRELLACVNALLRRQVNQVDRISFGNTMLDIPNCMLRCGDRYVRLSAREFAVMRLFFQSQEHILKKEVILTHVWGIDTNAVDNHVEVYVGFLRKKLKLIGSNIRIIALRRIGYCMEVEKGA